MDRHVPDGVDGLHDELAQRRARLHDARRDAAGKVVLEEAERLAQHVGVRLPADAGRHGGRDHLVLDEIVHRRDARPRDERHERHADERPLVVGEELRRGWETSRIMSTRPPTKAISMTSISEPKKPTTSSTANGRQTGRM